MAKTIVLSNQKGGVGKTTTANTLALIFRERGCKVLAVDLDPQGNLSFSTGADTDGTATIYEVLKEEVKSRFAVQKTGLVDIIPSNILLSSIELEFSGNICFGGHWNRWHRLMIISLSIPLRLWGS